MIKVPSVEFGAGEGILAVRLFHHVNLAADLIEGDDPLCAVDQYVVNVVVDSGGKIREPVGVAARIGETQLLMPMQHQLLLLYMLQHL